MLPRGRRLAALALALAAAASALPLAAPAAAAPAYDLDAAPGLEYVAIAPLSFADHLKPLISWKNEKGVPAKIFVTEQILQPPFTGRDSAETLHNFLQNLYFNLTQRTAKYLLLVGDGDWDRPIIPLREVFTNSQQDDNLADNQNWYTTDTYYGNLESNWDEDNDGIFGELDEGDWTPEMYVGRVPVDTTAQLDLWVARQLTYEKNPTPGPWMTRAVLAGALMDRPNVLDNPLTAQDEGYDPFTDNAWKVDEEVAAQVPSRFSITRLYDYPFWEGGRYGPLTDNLVAGATKTAIDAGASFVLIEGHGYTSNRGVAQYNDPAGTKSIWRSETEAPLLRYEEVLNLTNSDMLPFLYVSACYSGDFTDRDDTSFEAFLKAPSGGAIAVVAGNGENFRLENVSGQQAFGNWWLAQQFFRMIFVEGTTQPGKVLGDLKARYNDYYLREGPTDAVNRNYFRAERVSYNLMGDPEFSLITDYPARIDAAPVRQPYVGENLVEIRVAGRGGALAGALVHLRGPGGDAHGRTDAWGLVTLPYAFADTTAFNLTVTAANHLPLQAEFAPAVPEHNLAFDSSGVTVSGTPVRGAAVTVEATVVARGLQGFANVPVEFRIGNPSTGTLVGGAWLPQVVPGAPVGVEATLRFDSSGVFLVYASIDPGGTLTEDTQADNVAFATVAVNAPPELVALPRVVLDEGQLVPTALRLSAYAYDRDTGSFGLTYQVVSVESPLLGVMLSGDVLSLEALPGSGGSLTVTLEVSDGLESSRANLAVFIVRHNAPPVLEPLTRVTAYLGEPFSLALRGTDPDGLPLLWSDLSPLFEVTPDGRIAFTPAADQVGRYAITVLASDGRASTSQTFLLVIERREQFLDVRNLPVIRATAGTEVVIDLNALSSDPGVAFVTDRQDVTIEPLTRILRFRPAAELSGVETIRLTATKEGFAPRTVTLTVDLAAPPSKPEAAIFGTAILALAAAIGAGLFLAHRRRLRDEQIFKIEGRPPARPAGASRASAAKKGGTSSKEGRASPKAGSERPAMETKSK